MDEIMEVRYKELSAYSKWVNKQELVWGGVDIFMNNIKTFCIKFTQMHYN